MKKILAVAVACVLSAAACSSAQKTTIHTSAGTTTVSSNANGKTVTLRSKDEKMTVAQGPVDASKLGVPVYPGATTGATLSYAGKGANGVGTMVTFTSSDPFETVYAWYKAHLPAGSAKMKISSSDSSMATFVVPGHGKAKTSVMLTGGKETQIEIVSGTATP